MNSELGNSNSRGPVRGPLRHLPCVKGYIGCRPCLVDEHESRWIKIKFFVKPALAKLLGV